jgi:hypothetical protein
MMICNVPIEPIEERYSADWNRWFKQELIDRKYSYVNISLAPRVDKIREGAFLDVIGTMHYKAIQIAKIAEYVDDGTIPRNEKVIFLVHDGWFPIEQLAYMRDMLGCYEWKFVGIFHAGTYDRWDQTAQHGMYQWGEDLENAWFKIYDMVVVASDYHANLLMETRNIPLRKIEIIPWKVEVPKDLIGTKKINCIVYPHRFNVEKQPELYYKLQQSFHPEGESDWFAIDTAERQKTKHAYYEVLAKSKIAVSFSLQETFGIAMVEAVLLGCIPLVPDRLAYQEMYPKTFRYQGEKEFKEKLDTFCNKSFSIETELSILQENFKRQSELFFPDLFRLIEDL